MTALRPRPLLVLLIALAAGGCSSGQKTVAQRRADFAAAEQKAHVTTLRFKKADANLESFFEDSVGYAVFPTVGKGAFIIGGGGGSGIVYMNEADGPKAVGSTGVIQGSIGLQAGGQAFSEMIFFEDHLALSKFKAGNFELDAGASAVAAGDGASMRARYDDGVAIFVMNEKGLMVEASVGGQKFSYDRRP